MFNKKPVVKEEKKLSLDGKKKKAPPELLRGFRDVLPEEQAKWDAVRDQARGMADAYSFGRIELPVLERADLWTRTLGKHTDVVEKEMYTFIDPSETQVALRPEGTASIARAYINHGMWNLPQPVKLWYDLPMFRHDRPQAGRYRQHQQIGFEVLGVQDPVVDAQLILIATRLFQDLGIKVSVQLNSIGTPESRQAYLTQLTAYFRTHRAKLSEEDKHRLQKNPLRLLDSKDPQTIELLAAAPQILDWLDEDSKNHFMKVIEYLDEVQVPYVLNPHLVRGLDYYTHTVFEIWQEGDAGDRAQNSLCGGGRYDRLVEVMGGERPAPACGFAFGIERAVRAMTESGSAPELRNRPKIFFAQLGDAARRVGLRVFEEFRKAHVLIAEASGKNALKSQLEAANKLGVAYALILGQKEVLDGTILVRDMESGAQETVDILKIVPMMEKKLSGGSVEAES
ncbi:histidine--tRNA ligase [Candidatus Uhrbacteria bacterium]|nr:histidine--tRNA ligase [Candidatus Uhrbacteria bacterium]